MPLLQASPASANRESPTVAVIIPTYNRDDLLESCLEHLERQTFQAFRIIVVDNGPRHSMPSVLSRFNNLEWIPLFRNEGTAAAFNRGLAEAGADKYVFILNNDAELEAECLAHLVRALECDPNYCIAIPKLLQWSDSRFLDGVGDEILLGGGAYRVGSGELDVGQYDHPQPVFSACAAAVLYRRTLFEDIGGFDEDFFAYREDVDLGLRAQLRGHHCIFIPNARVRHRGSATMGTTFHPQIMRLSTRNQVFVILKDYPASILFRVLSRLLVFQILWLALAIQKHAFLSACMGLLDVVFFLPKMLAKRVTIQSERLLCDQFLLAILQESEMRIWRWHVSAHNPRPARLLAAYFRIFGLPIKGGALP